MAKANPNNERTEREFQLDVNQAVANTEAEVFNDAIGDDELENDGDTSLEEMGEGLEGEDLDEDEEDEADEEGEDGGEEAEEEGEEAAAEADEDEEDEEEPERDERGAQEQERPDRREIPLRAERDRRRQAEQELAQIRAELAEERRQRAEMNGRLTEISARQNTPKAAEPSPPKPRPDMFADPEGYDRSIREDARREAQEYVEQQMAIFQQQQRERAEARFNESLHEASLGERSEEVAVAHHRLVNSLNSNNPAHRALVQRIFDSPDPATALFKWWDQNGGDEYRASPEYQNKIQEKLDRAEREAEWYRSLLPGRQNPRQRSPQPQPRHVTQIPESLRRSPPSLNSARGGQRHEIADPDMMDDSDEAVFRHAARR